VKIILAKPRGFCAGVKRAVGGVLNTLQQFGPPVYVLNHIVHNAHVVQSLRDKGVIFVKDLQDVPPFATLLFSAHGVAPRLWAEAKSRCLNVVDATCPLVARVHKEVVRFARSGYTIVFVGDAGHDETVATVGHAPGRMVVLNSADGVDKLDIIDPDRVAYVTQTTLSVDDSTGIIAALRRRFPNIHGPERGNICYATANRQAVLRDLDDEIDLVLVVGDPESANSSRLASLARTAGKAAYLIPDATAICSKWMDDAKTILLTSGASVPEHLVEDVVAYFRRLYDCVIEERELAVENMQFPLPKIQRSCGE